MDKPLAKPHLTLEEVQALLAKAEYPRVTAEGIEANIADLRYLEDDTTTICIIEMKNGFKFIGTSTPADPRNYHADVGERYAYDNAFRQIWTHEGYLLRNKLAEEGDAHR